MFNSPRQDGYQQGSGHPNNRFCPMPIQQFRAENSLQSPKPATMAL